MVFLDITACGGVIRRDGFYYDRYPNSKAARCLFCNDNTGFDAGCHTNSPCLTNYEWRKGDVLYPIAIRCIAFRHPNTTRLCRNGEHKAGLLLYRLYLDDSDLCRALPVG